MSELKLGLKEAGELETTLRRAGWSNAMTTLVTQDVRLAQRLLAVIEGRASVSFSAATVDIGAYQWIASWARPVALLPDAVREEDVRILDQADFTAGQQVVELSEATVGLCPLSEVRPPTGKPVCGFEMWKIMASRGPLPIQAMSYYLNNPSEIPSEWDQFEEIVFMGTVCQDTERHNYMKAPMLVRDKNTKHWTFDWLSFNVYCNRHLQFAILKTK